MIPPPPAATLPTDPDVVVVGAGAAGIAAATALRAEGLACVVLEAADRVGGRCRTESDSLGSPFDHGASWLHAGDRNPLVPLAGRLGIGLLDQRRGERDRVTFVDGRRATAAELAEYDAAEEAFHASAFRLDRARAAAGGPDLPLSAATPDRRFAATVEAWEGPVISAAEADAISLEDWAANLLDGPNYAVSTGLGALVARLAEGLPVVAGAPVTRIEWGGPAGGTRVRVSGPRGTVRARCCLVTVSTGVLAAGSIAFDPPLPEATRDAVAALPMGLLTKVALRAARQPAGHPPERPAGRPDGPDRLDLPDFAGIDREVARGERLMVFQAWPFGRDHVIGFVGGRSARALAGVTDAEAVALAREELRRGFGTRADRALDPARAVVTRWGTDPLTLGSYSYAVPGGHAARLALARPVAPGRLHLAGEACHPHLAGTAGGAWQTGLEAGAAIARALRGAAGPAVAPAPRAPSAHEPRAPSAREPRDPTDP
ncbi:flavin monoamine oxidase family protein [Roseomonas acroporae]|uniref:flavin monoamine oxidase family protein n=1 Tax=Roseomonas acroporae TaxID=2937791 RepID=UPI0031F52F00